MPSRREHRKPARPIEPATMTSRQASSSPAATTDMNTITELNDNDVLLGRGTGASQFIGKKLRKSDCRPLLVARRLLTLDLLLYCL